jgi:hypothetical protein
LTARPARRQDRAVAKKTTRAAPAAYETDPAPRGPGELRVELVPLGEIKLRPRNVKRHGDADVAEIASSLDQFEQRKNVVLDASGYCVAGEGTVRAARKLGWTHVWANRWEAPETAARGYALADNRTAELAQVDYRLLAEELQDLSALGAPVDGLGWDEHELSALIAASWGPAPGTARPPAPEVGSGPGGAPPPAPDPVPTPSPHPAPSAGAGTGAAPPPAQGTPAWPAPAPPPAPAARWICFAGDQWERLRPAVEAEALAAGVPEAEAVARLALRGAGAGT